ncbi:carboxypeptidase-like regulatory domain-containing protein [Halosquirtibacter xylanolyticus]|uniref:TonB-dependent receptor n=1 Tax=Halosquirtibacter xylanolyticus TaxID=3374599 RepID=UPI003749A516|nr:carboxypeptidase-like regulatory domain-containing protein [Prolixibacteraceae bacterium]
MRCFFCLMLLIVVFVPRRAQAQAQYQTICGMVLDRDTHQPVKSVSVLVKNTSRRYEVLSDTKGFFQLTEIPIGSYTIFVRYIGYKTVTVTGIDLNENHTPFVQVYIEKEVEEVRKVIPRYEQLNEVPYSDVLTGAVASREEMYSLPNKGPLDKSSAVETVGGAYRVDQYGANYSMGSVSPLYNRTKLGGALNISTAFMDGLQTENLLTYGDEFVFFGQNNFTSLQSLRSESTIGNSGEIVMSSGYFKGNEFGISLNSDGASVEGQGGLRAYERFARSSYKFSYNYFKSDLIPQQLFRTTNLPVTQDFNLSVYVPTLKYGTFAFWTKAVNSKRDVSAKDSLYIPWNITPYSEMSDDKTAVAAGMRHRIHFKDGKFSLENDFGWMNQKDKGSERNSRQLQYAREYDLAQQQFGWNSRFVYKPTGHHHFTVGLTYNQYNQSLCDTIWNKGEKKALYGVGSQKFREWSTSVGYMIRFTNKISSFIGGKYISNSLPTDNYWSANAAIKLEITPSIHWKVGANLGKMNQPWSLYERVQDVTKIEEKEVVPVKYSALPLESYVGLNSRFDIHFGSQIYWMIDGDYKMLSNLWVDKSPSSFAMVNWGSNPFNKLPNEMTATGEGSVLRLSTSVEKCWEQNTYIRITGTYFKTSLTTSDGQSRVMAWDPKYVITSALGGRIDISRNSHFTGGVDLRLMGARSMFEVDVEGSKKELTTVYKSSEDYTVELKTPLVVGANVSWFYNSRRFGHQIKVRFENMTDASYGGYQYWSFHNNEVVEPKSIGLYGQVSYIIRLGFERSKKIKKSWY